MLYYSLANRSDKVDFATATINGQAPDGGLYFPEKLPRIAPELISNIEAYSNETIAYEVIRPYVGGVIPDKELKQIVAETVAFDIPLVQVRDDIFSLELFHGPTLAFKDVGARFMSRCLGYFSKKHTDKVTVLVATSGDTGSAVAAGFYNVPGVDVVILYPAGRVSTVQEAQLSTLGNNITALRVGGTFDDCQRMVKRAFKDEPLRQKLFLSSANSINVARWLPQQFYYFFAYKQWQDKAVPPVIAVPSGNFGNICAGMLAQVSGLPVKHFIAACNANDVVTRYLSSGNYEVREAVATISNAMDVGNPSNFVRIMELFNGQLPEVQKAVTSASITDEETKAVIKTVYDETGYLLDPHGAVGYLALKHYLEVHREEKGIFLETAHPVKFEDAVSSVTGARITIPQNIMQLMKGENRSIDISIEYEALKEFLLKK